MESSATAFGIDAVAVKQAVREGDVLRLTLDVLPQKDCLKVVLRNRAVESIAADGFVFDAKRSLLLRI